MFDISYQVILLYDRAWGTICLMLVFAWQLYTMWLLIQLHESGSGKRYSRYLPLSMEVFGKLLRPQSCWSKVATPFTLLFPFLVILLSSHHKTTARRILYKFLMENYHYLLMMNTFYLLKMLKA